LPRIWPMASIIQAGKTLRTNNPNDWARNDTPKNNFK
jgi:hypothetical protein